MNVNIWDVTVSILALVTSGRAVDVNSLADSEVPLPDLLDHPDRTG